VTDGTVGVPREYRWFVAAAASWFFGWSIQSVVFTWLVIGDARAPGAILGTVQTALTLPGPAIALLGGVIADRLDRRTLVIAAHAGMALLSLSGAVARRAARRARRRSGDEARQLDDADPREWCGHARATLAAQVCVLNRRLAWAHTSRLQHPPRHRTARRIIP